VLLDEEVAGAVAVQGEAAVIEEVPQHADIGADVVPGQHEMAGLVHDGGRDHGGERQRGHGRPGPNGSRPAIRPTSLVHHRALLSPMAPAAAVEQRLATGPD
jgi:hypothetical protein